MKLNESVESPTVEEIKEEWRSLWRERIDDKVRAECIANRAYPFCFVDRGTIIVATRDFKLLNLKEIVSLYRIKDVERIAGPPPAVGGWHKFARTVLNKQARNRKLIFEKPRPDRVKNLQLKKGGRGWLHRNC